VGRKIGQYVVDHYFQPLTGSGGGALVAGTVAPASVDETLRINQVQPLAEALALWQAAGVAFDEPVTLSYGTTEGAATTRDSDYVAKTGTLTLAPGETTKSVTIEVKGDSKEEANETFDLDLFGTSGNSLFTKNRGLGTILNDD
jgi:hypothetical protein